MPQNAKDALDSLIKKSRVHLYKPIQIAEILYKHRILKDIDLLNLESYRIKSKKWRDEVTVELLHRVCNSSARFQDDLFNDSAIPPNILKVLGEENLRTNGAVEAYIYRKFDEKHNQLSNALNYCLEAKRETFDVAHFINSFESQSGLKRSLDKVYEIVVYSLFTTIVEELELQVKISLNKNKIDIMKEFGDFSKSVLNIDLTNLEYVDIGKIYRVGVTNAADRGLDMYTNWGPVVQVKHLSLNESVAQGIVQSVMSDRIIIVCKEAERSVIISLLSQIGWKARVQSIITEVRLKEWYNWEKNISNCQKRFILDNC
ncbi:HaeII family restriction endonuclease [bacterium AH-315-K05]|nr:HaeII family restriction endonuclease [bacterium AH-315-K05]